MNPQWMKGKVVGEGSFGTINLAMNKTTGALFVVKYANSGKALEALKNEAGILETLNSPYIVKCLGKDLVMNESNGRVQKLDLFMEYMAGGSLSEVAEKFGGALHEQVVRSYTREILEGLKYVHENGIVHCDLKCKNVLLGSSGNIKLADFGCAKRMKKDMKENLLSSIGGTPLWMAPEVLRNEGLNFSSDIWSLGCTVIEMATGRPPWVIGHNNNHDINPMAAILKISCGSEKPQFPSSFSKEGVDFLEKCLERDPNKRWMARELLTHPFITSRRELDMKEASSPASTLHFEEAYDSSDDDMEFFDDHRIIFTTRECECDEKKQQEEEMSEFGSSDDWLTVR
ncbi:putative ATP binding protein [Tripterygium wilfordii]|uniref:Putative ATP binding protein n=2 Tax=Tripterygium wilfordii TaxID=458696 RepID=A0A7J7DCJ4_TRIWF|nr:putative ATP binding protein [Tripterygium wilfordii]